MQFKGRLTVKKQEPVGSAIACVAMLSRMPLEIVTNAANEHGYVELDSEMRQNRISDLCWEFGVHLEDVTRTANLKNPIGTALGRNLYVLGVKSLTTANEKHYLVLDNRRWLTFDNRIWSRVCDPNKIVRDTPSYRNDVDSAFYFGPTVELKSKHASDVWLVSTAQCKHIDTFPILKYLSDNDDVPLDKLVSIAFQPRTPKKLVLAKMRNLVNKGYVSWGVKGYSLTKKGFDQVLGLGTLQ
jgi:hypothetical protein